MRAAAWLVLPAALIACSFEDPIWIQRSPNADPLYRFVQNGKAGYIDQEGKIVIPPRHPVTGNGGGEFIEGLLLPEGHRGPYVNPKGEVVLDTGFHVNWNFSEGLASALQYKLGLWSLIDATGRKVIPPTFFNPPAPFSEGLAAVLAGERYGYIDRTGVMRIPPRFYRADAFREGFARVIIHGPCNYIPDDSCPWFEDRLPACRYSLVDKSGKPVSRDLWDYASGFSEGLAVVSKGGKYGYIDREAKLALIYRYDRAYPFHDGLARIRTGGKYAFITKQGTLAFDATFDYADDFHEGFAVVSQSSSERFYVDKTGAPVFGRSFLDASRFFKGLAHVRLSGRPNLAGQAVKGTFAYIDTTGREVFRYETHPTNP